MDNKKLTVGQLAMKANVSKRTLQYYDNIDLLKPSEITESGRRLYDEQDMAVLHQIITMKTLGLSLDDIKQRLMPVDNEEDILKLLEKQSLIIEEQISKSKKVLQSIGMLKQEIMDEKKVNWAKYAVMLEQVKENNDYYWVLGLLDQEMIERIKGAHELDMDPEDAIKWFTRSMEAAVRLEQAGYSPDSDKAQALAKEWWSFMQRYTDGNQKLMDKLYDFYASSERWPEEFRDLQMQSKAFLEKTIQMFMEREKNE